MKHLSGNLFLILFSVSCLQSCAIIPGPANPKDYITVLTDIHSDPAPYILFEHGKRKSLYTASATAAFYWWLLPVWPADATTMSDHLFDYRVPPWDCLAAYEMVWGSRIRNLSAIQELANHVSPYSDAEIQQSQGPIRWILSSEPLVLAIGTDTAPNHPWQTCTLVQEKDLDKTATELIILDHWPPPWDTSSSDADQKFTQKLAPFKRSLKLDPPATLRDIINKRMWEHSPSSRGR